MGMTVMWLLFLPIILVQYRLVCNGDTVLPAVQALEGSSEIPATNEKKSDIVFSPWPHRRIIDGYLEDGEWITGGIPALSTIQRFAFNDGYFVPRNNITSTNPVRIHIFSSRESRACLKDRRLILAGDSYMKQMYIGLAEILLDSPSNEEIRDSRQRKATLKEMQSAVVRLSKRRPDLNLSVTFGYEDCSYSDLRCLISKLETDESAATADSIVANVLVHHMNKKENKDDKQAEKYIQQLKTLMTTNVGMNSELKLKSQLKLTWATGPAYNLVKVPEEYKEATLQRPTDAANLKALELGRALGVPTLDFFTLTGLTHSLLVLVLSDLLAVCSLVLVFSTSTEHTTAVLVSLLAATVAFTSTRRVLFHHRFIM
jgi:hypothetical protein